MFRCQRGTLLGFVEVDKFICPILHNQIIGGNNVFTILLDYGDEYIETLSVHKDIARNSLLVIDSSIHEKVKLREEFDILKEVKELHSLKIIRRKYMTPITKIIDQIFNRDLKIDEFT